MIEKDISVSLASASEDVYMMHFMMDGLAD
jgi:hypothetical protein